MQGDLTIELLSDACFSMPAAFDATVDTDVALDQDGLPAISGKTLHGLLRDTWLSLPASLDPGHDGIALFGEPRRHDSAGILRIGDAEVEAAGRQWVRWARKRSRPNPVSTAHLRDAFLARRVLTSTDRKTDSPQTETLRVMRVIPAGLTLAAPLSAACDLTDNQRELLKLITDSTRHAGLARNRGLGHVKLSVSWAKEQAATGPIPSPTITEGVLFLPLAIRLSAPCLISDESADLNSGMTRPFITGSAIRGSIAGAVERLGASDDLFQEIIVSGSVRFLNAYPAVDGRRALPTPITWQRKKDARLSDIDSDADARDRALVLAGESDREASSEQRQPFDTGFFAEISGRHRPARAILRQTVHQLRDRATGISIAGKTTVFVYEALEKGQTFLGAVALPANRPDLLEMIQHAVTRPMWLGRSARSGYGGAPHLEIGSLRSTEPGHDCPPIRQGEHFLVRLTSDALLRDRETGQHDPWRLQDEVEALIEGKAVVLKTYLQTVSRTGYHRLWRSNLPTSLCATAGSVVLLKAVADLTQEQLASLQSQAIGERGAEGFGCFVVDSQTLHTLSFEPAEDEKAQMPSMPAPESVMQAQRRLYEKRLRILLAEEAIEAANSASGLPSSASLVHRLRSPLRDVDHWQATFHVWLTGQAKERLKPTAREPLSEATIHCRYLHGGMPTRRRISLIDLLTLASDPDWVPLSERDSAERQACQIVSEEQSLLIWDDARRSLRTRYLDVLFSRLARRIQKEGNQ